MSNRNESYYNKERELLYESLLEKINDNVKYTTLSFKEFIHKYFRRHTQDEFGDQIELAKFHYEIVDKIINNTTYEALIQMARNHAKTTVFSLFLPIYLMLTNETHFVLLVSATKDAAVKQIMNIQTELETNDLLIRDFGIFSKSGNWSRGNFIVSRYETAFYCVGKGQSTRGLKYKRYRPDYIVLDDIDTDRETLNATIIEKQTNWVLQSVFASISLKKYRFIAVGNKFAPNMILTRLMNEVEGAEVLKIDAIDKKGNISWKERFNTAILGNIEKKIGKIRFQREFMNNPIIEGMVFKPEWLQWYTHTSQQYEYVLTYVDPSFKKEGDYKACVTIGYKSGKYYIIDIFEKKTNIDHVFNYLYDIYNPNNMIYFESNFAQDLHKKTYKEIEVKAGFPLPIVWDKSKKPNKTARIENMSVYFEKGIIFINGKLKNTNDFKQWYLEYLTFPSSKNDDGIDATESCITTINKKIKTSQPYMLGVRQTRLW